MKKVIKSLCGLAIAFVCLLTICSCIDISEVKSFELSKSPEGVYELNDKVEAKDFTVTITFTDGNEQTMNLTDKNLTVQGLYGEYIDTTTAGSHTIKISYQGFSIIFNYYVNGNITIETWENHTEKPTINGEMITVSKAEELAYIAANVSEFVGKTVVVENDIDLSAYEWKPIDNFYGKFKGKEGTTPSIKGLKVVNYQDGRTNGGLGLFGDLNLKGNLSISNIKLENTLIDVTRSNNSGKVEQYKNYGTLVGRLGGTGNVEISNVIVDNAEIYGVGRLGGLIGQMNLYGNVTISNCKVNGYFEAINPVSAAADEGEGDKLGSLIGQAGLVGNQYILSINDCEVKSEIHGTRDLGAVIGYNSSNIILKNIKVLDDTIVTADVAGGMNVNKGTRNVGAVIGTQSYSNKENTSVSFENVSFGKYYLNTNSQYEFSNSGKYIGGLRRESVNVTYNLTVSVDGVVKNSSITIPQKGGVEDNTLFRTRQETTLKDLFGELNK